MITEEDEREALEVLRPSYKENKELIPYREENNLIKRAIDIERRRGFVNTTMFFLEYLYQNGINFFGNIYLKRGHNYNVYRSFKSTLTPWRGERECELPLAKIFLDSATPDKIMEVGNVLNHYYNVNHLVVDKFEQGNNVINEDIVGFRIPRKFNLIISISTIEHIGKDEDSKNPLKFLKAIEVCKNLLEDNGQFIFTFSWNYNAHLEERVRLNKLAGFTYSYFKKQGVNWFELSEEQFSNLIKVKQQPNTLLVLCKYIKAQAGGMR